jgi:crossover junction endodeoxyribonuclease RuvC
VRRLVDIEARLNHIIDTALLVDLVLLEGYAYAAQNQAHQIGELGGVIRRMLHKRMQRWIEVAPSQVKKFAAGKGNAKKDLIIMQVYKRWGVEFTNSDEADAFVLAKIGQALVEKWDPDHEDNNPLTTFQWEVILDLRKKYKEVLL